MGDNNSSRLEVNPSSGFFFELNCNNKRIRSELYSSSPNSHPRIFETTSTQDSNSPQNSLHSQTTFPDINSSPTSPLIIPEDKTFDDRLNSLEVTATAAISSLDRFTRLFPFGSSKANADSENNTTHSNYNNNQHEQ